LLSFQFEMGDRRRLKAHHVLAGGNAPGYT
jgi:hypothetical protein